MRKERNPNKRAESERKKIRESNYRFLTRRIRTKSMRRQITVYVGGGQTSSATRERNAVIQGSIYDVNTLCTYLV